MILWVNFPRCLFHVGLVFWFPFLESFLGVWFSILLLPSPLASSLGAPTAQCMSSFVSSFTLCFPGPLVFFPFVSFLFFCSSFLLCHLRIFIQVFSPLSTLVYYIHVSDNFVFFSRFFLESVNSRFFRAFNPSCPYILSF